MVRCMQPQLNKRFRTLPSTQVQSLSIMFPLQCCLTCSTHTFLARAFIYRIGVPLEDLGYDLVFSAPSWSYSHQWCVRGVIVVIQQWVLSTDFVVMPMREFDTVFRMDWITRHRTLIDCQKKKFQLHLSRKERLAFQGKGRGSRGSLITFQRTHQLVERWCEAFLTCIVATNEQSMLITSNVRTGGDTTHSIPVVGAELPTTRQIELTIEVLPSDASTFKASYQTPPLSTRNSRASYGTCVNGDSFGQVIHPRMCQFYL